MKFSSTPARLTFDVMQRLRISSKQGENKVGYVSYSFIVQFAKNIIQISLGLHQFCGFDSRLSLPW